MSRFRYAIFILCLFFTSRYTYAADIILNISHFSINDDVTVTVENGSDIEVKIRSVHIDLASREYSYSSVETIASGQSRSYHYKVLYPLFPGSYPLTAIVKYENEDKTVSLVHTALFHYREKAVLNISCSLEPSVAETEGRVTLKSSQPDIWKLILPQEIEISKIHTLTDRKIFHVVNNAKELKNTYTIFAVAEQIREGKHYAAVCSGKLFSGFSFSANRKGRGYIPSDILMGISLFFGLVSVFMIRRESLSKIANVTCKYACRMFFVSFFYLMLKNMDVFFEYSALHISWKHYRYLAAILTEHFRGFNYQYFFKYFVDFYLLACLLLLFPYLYYYEREKFVEQDKYAATMKYFASICGLIAGRKIFWSPFAKLGLLTICVKLFYIPYLSSWVINNTFHQINLTRSFHWDIYSVNAYLVALFIYIDTSIFCFGYLVEAKFLKNEIRSVEPTLMGWIVCLWCYPPFNLFSFRIFDFQIIDIPHTYPEWLQILMLCLITLLWGIFTWASVAIGFKASNLTNRGIVSTGPYRFVRHPAYTAKVGLWIIEGVFFAKFTVGLMLGFLMIYLLRAWTEERHLSRDDDYIAYKGKVKRMFLPGII